MRIVILNGQVVAAETAAISVYDRGFLYGDSVFETIRVYGGKPFALAEHLVRLERSAERVFISLPVPLGVIAEEVKRGIGLSQEAESFVRVMLTRGTGPLGLDPDLAEKPSRVVLVEPFVPPTDEAYERGIEAITVHVARASDATPAAGAKVANYLTSLLAIREARRRGAVEAFIVDARGSVLEGTTSNVFFVRDGELVTPPEQAESSPGSRARTSCVRRTRSVSRPRCARCAKRSYSRLMNFSSPRRCAKSCPSFAWTVAPSAKAGRDRSPASSTRRSVSTSRSKYLAD